MLVNDMTSYHQPYIIPTHLVALAVSLAAVALESSKDRQAYGDVLVSLK
jgi:hypothetical protein